MTATRPTALGGFLRAARGRATADARHLAPGGPRKVPGLRREEVAVLAGVSANYYTRLEQGRERHPSPQVVDALSGALGLNPDETGHLRALAGGAAPVGSPRADVAPELRALLDAWTGTPAVVLSDALDVLALNDLARAVHSGFARLDNFALLTFLDPHAAEFYSDWPGAAAVTAGNLRLALGRGPGDARLHEVIAELAERSAEFRRLWARNTAGGKSVAHKRFHHPEAGLLELTYQAFDVRGAPGQQLVVYAPEPGGRTADALARL
ncbi:helix-turn-helix transcriptional regulator [Saccharopolyspora sp. NPDC047091]|uniref:helix-turn-helix domain-containing protein n=1 Tax=Saccharopolyspora sp. NPDC047091 TaxID=3155924 RepID=UPI0033E49F3F